MSAGLPSDEVADDYKNSLEDLVTNDRYQIGNLTVIAKENIEHGEAIARVLENHIQRAPPPRKLPALYVLDSVVKNVGTPYTVYFGRNLYNTFMNAYTLVDGNIRKKLDEMLKTWREPVPGSLSTTPVFRLDVTQRIVDALSKARAAAQQSRTQQMPLLGQRIGGTPNVPFRNTPTPPQGLPPYGRSTYSNQPPSRNGFSGPYQNTQFPQPQAPSYPVQPPTTPQYQHLAYGAPTPNLVDLGTLHRDIDDLVVDAKIDCASHPTDQGARTKLSSLQSLKSIVESGKLSDRDLSDVRRSVSEQMSQRILPARPTPPPVPTPIPGISTPIPYSIPPNITQALAPSNTPSFLNPSNLADLIRATANRNQPTPPPAVLSLPFQTQVMNTPPVHHAAPAPTAAENPLIAQLRASGLLPATSTPPPHAMPLGQPFNSGFGVPNLIPPAQSHNAPSIAIDVQFTTASIRIPRPNLITTLFTARPNACNTCGRRFTSDDNGKETKARHLDWHFRTKTRMAEAEKRGVSRSWYIDERGWISSKEYEDDAGPPDSNGTSVGLLSPTGGSKNKAQDFVRAPNDPVLKNLPCPIDQEKFEQFWSDELQEFIWKDAIQVGNRIYHASCYRQVMDDRAKAATPVGAGRGTSGDTPDSVLGKRKAEQEETNGFKAKIKVETAS